MLLAVILTINAGAIVTWTNTEDEPHSVLSHTDPSHSRTVGSDESITFRFDEPGTYYCACSVHPRLIVAIVVE